jgi:hypothetical protein
MMKRLTLKENITAGIMMLAVILSPSDNLAQVHQNIRNVLIPEIDGEWWPIAGNPDLGYLSDVSQQPVDFGVWQADDHTWQLWSCIRGTREPGKSRLFYGWKGTKITDSNWSPKGIKMRSDPLVGEIPGGMQAPYVIREADDWFMFYGDWNAICMAHSKDGKLFERMVMDNQERVTAMFTEGAGTNTRDAMVIKENGIYYCYYTAGIGFRNEAVKNTGAVYCRTSKDKLHWSGSVIVSKGGRSGNGWGDHECPFVVKIGENFYLFRTQRYGGNNVTSVYCSNDPLNFGVDNDEGFFVITLPVAAPELVFDDGQWYIFALNPELDGIRAARLKWKSK